MLSSLQEVNTVIFLDKKEGGRISNISFSKVVGTFLLLQWHLVRDVFMLNFWAVDLLSTSEHLHLEDYTARFFLPSQQIM